MNLQKRFWLLLAGVVSLILFTMIVAFSATTSVPSSRLTDQIKAITANDLKPSQCSALNLTAIYVCPGTSTCTGTSANELILGKSNAETINGGAGNDCILGGGGNDAINGGNGTDVCIGGPGTDTFSNCETQVQ
jgi:hypothetical protein